MRGPTARRVAVSEPIGVPERPGNRLLAYLALGKTRLSVLVALTAGVAFVLASPAAVDWPRLLWTVLGTALAAVGANALNQWREEERDARMARTCRRPLPAGRLARPAAAAFGLTVGLAGPLVLAAATNAVAAVLALATLVLYVTVYTPLKAHSPLNTLVGAVVGALPPLVGWVAAAGTLAAGAWVLGGILFLWQIPHFLALVWLHRDDYARAEFRMLAGADPAGHFTGCVVVLYTLALVPLSMSLTLAGVTGRLYAGGALVAGAGLVLASIGLERQRTRAAARRLFIASVVYLPVLLGLMLVDRVVAARG